MPEQDMRRMSNITFVSNWSVTKFASRDGRFETFHWTVILCNMKYYCGKSKLESFEYIFYG